MLIAIEQSLRALFFSYQDMHHLLQVEKNRWILARHIGIDCLCCCAVAYIGIKNRCAFQDLTSHALGRSNAMPDAGFEKRLFSYHPGAQHILLVFFAFQVKNLYDTVVWNDGPEFIFHHVVSGIVAWGAMYPGLAHFYGVFFMGVSEISTAILCLLANFDDEHGVPGLGDAFPTAKIVIAVAFVVAFIICRTLLWPYFSYFFIRDCRMALKNDTPHTRARSVWIKLFMGILAGLSLLQFAWLIQIGMMAKQELEKIV